MPNAPLSPRILRHRRALMTALALATMVTGCSRDRAESKADVDAQRAATHQREGIVTVSGDDRIARTLTWDAPPVALGDDVAALAAARKQANAAMAAGDLYANAGSAVPLYLALHTRQPDDEAIAAGLQRALMQLIAQGDRALADAGRDIAALREAHQVAAVVRVIDENAAESQAYLHRIDTADRLWELNYDGEKALLAGRYGERGGGALARFREVLKVQPDQQRAMQGLAATESALIRRAEDAAAGGNFTEARRWLGYAGAVRPDSATVPDAKARIELLRAARISGLRDAGLRALPERNGITIARARLADILHIADPGDAMAAELRDRIDLAEHYGLFRPGQSFTDALKNGARGPQLIVVPHGAFRMGAPKGEPLSSDNERPQRALRFERGFAMSVDEVTVAEYQRFVEATKRETRAVRRGFSMVYDERSGNFTRRSGVDWRSDYTGQPAVFNQPVLHVSAKDADAYAAWLSAQSGHRYRLPSEAEFEYVLRAGGSTVYPWGDGKPPAGAGNVTGSRDRSPGGRSWSVAFGGYSDGAWGPTRVGVDAANAWGLHDMAGNVSEWVADCWHDGFRRAPADGSAWVNPGCRTRVIRGGSWTSAPAQVRSAWRAPVGLDVTNARIGFRVAREI